MDLNLELIMQVQVTYICFAENPIVGNNNIPATAR